jgi:hypothetical protein
MPTKQLQGVSEPSAHSHIVRLLALLMNSEKKENNHSRTGHGYLCLGIV